MIVRRCAGVDIDARALADEIVAEARDLDVGDDAAALDLGIDDAHAPFACVGRALPSVKPRAPISTVSPARMKCACRSGNCRRRMY